MAVRYLKEAYNNLPKWLTDYFDSGSGKSTKNALIKKGLDLANASYVPDQMITSGRDKRLSDPTKIQIFRFPGEREPYIKGYNQGPYIYDLNKYTSSLSGKDLIKYASEFGYIDFAANNVSDLRKDRRNSRIGSVDRGLGQHHEMGTDYIPSSWDEHGNYTPGRTVNTGWKWIQAKGQDKSGYPLNPSKYKDMLDNVGLDNYADRLQKYYDKIEAMRSQIIDIINNATLDKATSKDARIGYGSMYETISDCVRSLDRCINEYNRIREEIDAAISKPDEYDERYPIDRRISNLFKFYGSALRSYIDDTKKYIKNAQDIIQ